MSTDTYSTAQTKTVKADCAASENCDEYVHAIPASVLCCVCEKLLSVPVQFRCGDRSCERCYKETLRQDNPVCPGCGESLMKDQAWRDVFAEKEIGLLEVFCRNKSRGCTWSGTKAKVQSHVSICECQPSLCPNGCGMVITPVTRESHATKCKQKPLHCKLCNREYPLIEADSHQRTCPEVLVSCPNNCSTEMLRKNLKDHLETCKDTRQPCSVVNCSFKGDFEKLKKHETEAITPHLRAVSEGYESVRKEIGECREDVRKKEQDLRTTQRANEKDIADLTERVSSLEFQSTEIQAQQKLGQTKILEACYQSVDNAQKDYQAKFLNVEHHLRMMTEKMLKMEEIISSQATRIRSLEGELSTVKRTGAGVSTGGLGSDLIEQQFSQQDRVLANHDVKLAEHGLRIDMLDCKNTEGVLLWKITEIRRRRREAVSGKTPSIYSQPFYTSGCGYKLCARLYLNGDGMGKGTHLSLFFVVMRGEYDSLLPWPFQQKVTLVLVDQVYGRNVSDTFRPDPTSSSFKRPKNEMNIASGCPLFVSLPTLDTGCYIKDDTMFVKVIVDTQNVERPDKR